MSNPANFRYLDKIIRARRRYPTERGRLLDVGCGGGYLAEELACNGLVVAGIDPAPETIAAARAHARHNQLIIDHREGRGEALPFAADIFDFVCCSDVLEQVSRAAAVIAEVARFLKPGGLFFLETINRALVSWVVMIKVPQEWSPTAFLEQHAHRWSMFIKPRELLSMLDAAGLVNLELRGLGPGPNFVAHYLTCGVGREGKPAGPNWAAGAICTSPAIWTWLMRGMHPNLESTPSIAPRAAPAWPAVGLSP